MSNKIVKIPVREQQRRRNQQGAYAVPCEVSERWMCFKKKSSIFRDGEYLSLQIMTIDSTDSPRKLCQLVITRENLMKVISKITPE